MSTKKIQDLVIKDDDKIIEYKQSNGNIEHINSNKNLSSLELYKKLLESNEFKKPETKEKILEEDEYIIYLEELISRDYFPDLYRINKMKKEVNKII